MTAEILVPVSFGELLDKISILQIKSERISDEGKLANVRRELSALEKTWMAHPAAVKDIAKLRAELKAVNEQLWDIEDDIRLKEKAQAFDQGFVDLARSVYLRNDERARIKKAINLALGSAYVEEKSYQDYAPRVIRAARRSPQVVGDVAFEGGDAVFHGDQFHHIVELDLGAPFQIGGLLGQVLACRIVVAVHAVATVRVRATTVRVAGRMQAQHLGAHRIGDVHRAGVGRHHQVGAGQQRGQLLERVLPTRSSAGVCSWAWMASAMLRSSSLRPPHSTTCQPRCTAWLATAA